MILCLCRAVGDRAIRSAISSGAHTLDEIAGICGAGTDCGACRVMLGRLIEEAWVPLHADARAILPHGRPT